jgi:WD40 repeat protein/serine/threonine protein kinase
MIARRPSDTPDPSQTELEKRLLDYDEMLEAGLVPESLPLSGMSDELREGLSCLDMLERLRLSQLEHESPVDRSDTRHDSAYSQEPHSHHEEINSPAHARQFGRFELLKVIGQGGCGVVFLARDPVLGRQVAIKIPRPEALLTQELRQRFVREGRAAAGLDHPNLLSVLEAGEVGAICYLASAYCPGLTLREWIANNPGPAAPRTVAGFIATLAEAMEYAHQNGVCHRDLKPSNILLVREERRAHTNPTSKGNDSLATSVDSQFANPKIIDFGLAKVLQSESAQDRTRTGLVLGTPHYMAPEQARGQTSAIGPAADIHALGVILYELLTGRPPFQGETDPKVLEQVVSAEPVRPRRLRPRLPRDLETICLKCLEKQPEKRYATMADLADDLKRFVEGMPVRARRVGRIGRATRWVRRHPRASLIAVSVGVLLSALVAGVAWSVRRESAFNADMKLAVREIDSQKARAEENDWLARCLQYASQIRACEPLKSESRKVALRDALLTQLPAPGQRDVRGFEWHYLWSFAKIMTPDRRVVVTSVAYSRNGEKIASGGVDGVIHIFDASTCAPRAKLAGHKDEVKQLHFLNDDTQLLSTAFAVSPDGKTFHDEYVLWDLTGGGRILRRGAYSHSLPRFGLATLAPAPDGRVLFYVDRGGTEDRIVKIDVDTGAEHELLKVARAHSVACTPDGSRLIVLRVTYVPSEDQWNYDVVLTVDPATGQVLAEHEIAERGVHMAEFSPNGKTVALGTGYATGRNVEIRQFPTFNRIHSFRFEKLPIFVRFDRQGTRLLVWDAPPIHSSLFDVASGKLLGAINQEKFTTSPMAFSPDGSEFAGGTVDGNVLAGKHLFAPEGFSLPGPTPKSEAWCVAFLHDGKTLAAGYDHEDGTRHETLRLCEVAAKKEKSLAGHSATVMALAVSPDGKTLASASFDQTVRIWDLATGKCLREVQGHSDAVRTLAFSPDGLQLASGCSRFIKTWQVTDGAPLQSWTGHDDIVRSLVYSPDGKLLISAGNDRKIKVWYAADGSVVRVIENEAKVQGIACSPDGRLLASADEKNKVALWQVADGSLWKTLLGHTGKVRCVAFSPDAKTLASGGEDKVVRLWNVVTGQELLQLPTDDFVNGLAFAADSRVLAAALHNGAVKVWAGD